MTSWSPISTTMTSACSLGSGGGIFQSPVTYATGTEPTSVAIGDLRNDGNEDVVVTNWKDNTVSVLLNNGNGTFQTRVDYATADGPNVVVLGDVNGDGKPDLVVACDGSVSILLGNGDGTFQAHSDIGVGLGSPAVVLADFTGGGSLDIAALDSESIVILLNNGTGSFSAVAPVILPNTGGYLGYGGLAAADFNGDGKLDLAVAGAGGVAGILVALGNGDGTFKTPVFYPGVGGTSMAVADFNGDGIPDVAAGAFYGVDLFVGKGDGTFLPHVVYPTGSSQVSSVLATGDLTGNGTADLAVVNGAILPGSTTTLAVASDTVTVLLNAGQVATPDFSVSSPSSLTPSTISPGQSATATVTLGSMNGFGSTVTFSCSVSPTPALAPTCSFNPQQVQMKSGGHGTSTLTINTTASTAALWSPSLRRDLLPMYAALVPVFGIVLVGFGRGGRRKKLAGAIICTALLGSVAFQVACGGGSGSSTAPSGTPAGSYTVSVTASSGATQHTASLTLTVQ
jgi:hypothetical protein